MGVSRSDVVRLVDEDDVVLTQRQIEILVLRRQGLTQGDVAERLGTTSANVSIVEKSARDNVEKARRTVEFIESLSTHMLVEVEEGDDVQSVVGKVYDEADSHDVQIEYSKPEFYSKIHDEVREHLEGSRFSVSMTVGVTEKGGIEFYA